MNLFKILARDDGNINEPNVTSFLSFLLDEKESHGLGSSLLEKFIEPICIKYDIRQLLIEDRVTDLSRHSMFKTYVEAEYRVGVDDRKKDIDIVVKVVKDNYELVIAVENKITDGAISHNQLSDEVRGLINDIKINNRTNVDIAMIFLTPDLSKMSSAAFAAFTQSLGDLNYQNIYPMHYQWYPNDDHHSSNEICSVYNMFSKILELEYSGRIDPVHEYTKYTIKSFMGFIKSRFRSYLQERNAQNEKSNYGITYPDCLKEIYDSCDDHTIYEKEELKERFLSQMKAHAVNSAATREPNKTQMEKVLTKCIINEPKRRSYNVNRPDKDEDNLFFYPDETDPQYIRKINLCSPPQGICIYWADSDKQAKSALITDYYPNLSNSS